MESRWFNKHRLAKKTISVLISFVFICNFVLQDAWAVVTSPATIPYTAEPEKFPQLDVETFTLSPDLGTIRFSWKAPLERTPQPITPVRGQEQTRNIIIHIQDAHCNYAAQKKIAQIIEHLNKEYGITSINLEGGVGNYDLSPFTSISDKEIRQDIADYFVRWGRVNGAEYFALNNPTKVRLWGVEDTDTYLKNLNVYRDSLTYKDEVDKYLKQLNHILNNLKRRIYSEELLELDTRYAQYKTETFEFKDYLTYLLEKAKQQGINTRDFPNIYLLSQSLQEENKINFKRANSERDILIDKLQKILSRNELTEFVSKTVQFKSKNISQNDFYEYLIKKANQTRQKLDGFPQLQKYIIYISLYNAVDKSVITDEMERLETEIKDTLYRNNKERELNLLSKNFILTKNIFGFSFTKNDYEYYKENKSAFEIYNLLSFIKKEAPLYKITAKVDKNIAKLDGYREKIFKFFEYSFERDTAFLKNLKFADEKRNTENAVRNTILITGGFHTENLCELFKENNISYISIMPNFTNEEGYESPYFDILSGGVSPIERSMNSAMSFMQVVALLNGLGAKVEGQDKVEMFRMTVEAIKAMRYALEMGDTMPRCFKVKTREGKERFVILSVEENGNVSLRHQKTRPGDDEAKPVSDEAFDVNDFANLTDGFHQIIDDVILKRARRKDDYLNEGSEVIKRVMDNPNVPEDLKGALKELIGKKTYLDENKVTQEPEGYTGVQVVGGLFMGHTGQAIYLPASAKVEDQVNILLHELVIGMYRGSRVGENIDSRALGEVVVKAIMGGDIDLGKRLLSTADKYEKPLWDMTRPERRELAAVRDFMREGEGIKLEDLGITPEDIRQGRFGLEDLGNRFRNYFRRRVTGTRVTGIGVSGDELMNLTHFGFTEDQADKFLEQARKTRPDITSDVLAAQILGLSEAYLDKPTGYVFEKTNRSKRFALGIYMALYNDGQLDLLDLTDLGLTKSDAARYAGLAGISSAKLAARVLQILYYARKQGINLTGENKRDVVLNACEALLHQYEKPEDDKDKPKAEEKLRLESEKVQEVIDNLNKWGRAYNKPTVSITTTALYNLTKELKDNPVKSRTNALKNMAIGQITPVLNKVFWMEGAMGAGQSVRTGAVEWLGNFMSQFDRFPPLLQFAVISFVVDNATIINREKPLFFRQLCTNGTNAIRHVFAQTKNTRTLSDLFTGLKEGEVIEDLLKEGEAIKDILKGIRDYKARILFLQALSPLQRRALQQFRGATRSGKNEIAVDRAILGLHGVEVFADTSKLDEKGMALLKERQKILKRFKELLERRAEGTLSLEDKELKELAKLKEVYPDTFKMVEELEGRGELDGLIEYHEELLADKSGRLMVAINVTKPRQITGDEFLRIYLPERIMADVLEDLEERYVQEASGYVFLEDVKNAELVSRRLASETTREVTEASRRFFETELTFKLGRTTLSDLEMETVRKESENKEIIAGLAKLLNVKIGEAHDIYLRTILEAGDIDVVKNVINNLSSAKEETGFRLDQSEFGALTKAVAESFQALQVNWKDIFSNRFNKASRIYVITRAFIELGLDRADFRSNAQIVTEAMRGMSSEDKSTLDKKVAALIVMAIDRLKEVQRGASESERINEASRQAHFRTFYGFVKIAKAKSEEKEELAARVTRESVEDAGEGDKISVEETPSGDTAEDVEKEEEEGEAGIVNPSTIPLIRHIFGFFGEKWAEGYDRWAFAFEQVTFTGIALFFFSQPILALIVSGALFSVSHVLRRLTADDVAVGGWQWQLTKNWRIIVGWPQLTTPVITASFVSTAGLLISSFLPGFGAAGIGVATLVAAVGIHGIINNVVTPLINDWLDRGSLRKMIDEANKTKIGILLIKQNQLVKINKLLRRLKNAIRKTRDIEQIREIIRTYNLKIKEESTFLMEDKSAMRLMDPESARVQIKGHDFKGISVKVIDSSKVGIRIGETIASENIISSIDNAIKAVWEEFNEKVGDEIIELEGIKGEMYEADKRGLVTDCAKAINDVYGVLTGMGIYPGTVSRFISRVLQKKARFNPTLKARNEKTLKDDVMGSLSDFRKLAVVAKKLKTAGVKARESVWTMLSIKREKPEDATIADLIERILNNTTEWSSIGVFADFIDALLEKGEDAQRIANFIANNLLSGDLVYLDVDSVTQTFFLSYLGVNVDKLRLGERLSSEHVELVGNILNPIEALEVLIAYYEANIDRVENIIAERIRYLERVDPGQLKEIRDAFASEFLDVYLSQIAEGDADVTAVVNTVIGNEVRSAEELSGVLISRSDNFNPATGLSIELRVQVREDLQRRVYTVAEDGRLHLQVFDSRGNIIDPAKPVKTPDGNPLEVVIANDDKLNVSSPISMAGDRAYDLWSASGRDQAVRAARAADDKKFGVGVRPDNVDATIAVRGDTARTRVIGLRNGLTRDQQKVILRVALVAQGLEAEPAIASAAEEDLAGAVGTEEIPKERRELAARVEGEAPELKSYEDNPILEEARKIVMKELKDAETRFKEDTPEKNMRELITYHNENHFNELFEFFDALTSQHQLFKDADPERPKTLARLAIYLHDLGYFDSEATWLAGAHEGETSHEDRSIIMARIYAERLGLNALELEAVIHMIDKTRLNLDTESGFGDFDEEIKKDNRAYRLLRDLNDGEALLPKDGSFLVEYMSENFSEANLDEEADRITVMDAIMSGKVIAVADIYGQAESYPYMTALIQPEFKYDADRGDGGKQAAVKGTMWEQITATPYFLNKIAIDMRLKYILGIDSEGNPVDGFSDPDLVLAGRIEQTKIRRRTPRGVQTMTLKEAREESIKEMNDVAKAIKQLTAGEDVDVNVTLLRTFVARGREKGIFNKETAAALEDKLRGFETAGVIKFVADQRASNIGKVLDKDGNVKTGGFTVRDEGNAIVIGSTTDDMAGREIRIKKAQDEDGNDITMEPDEVATLLDSLLERPHTLAPDNARKIIEDFQDELSLGNVKKVVALEDDKEIKGHIDREKGVLYLNANLMSNPLGLFHEIGEGFVPLPEVYEALGLTRHTYMRGVGKDVRAAYGVLLLTDKVDMDNMTDEEFINTLEGKMAKMKLRTMTESEKALIRYNYSQIQEGNLRDNAGLGSKMMLFGLQDHLDPAGNARFTRQIKILTNDLRRGTLNIILIPAYNIELMSPQETWGRKAGRKFRKIGVNTVILHYNDDNSLESQLAEALEIADEGKESLPNIFVETLTPRQREQVAGFLGSQSEQRREALEKMITVGQDSLPKGATLESAQVDEVKVITIANAILNDKRLREDFKMGPEDLAESRLSMLTAFVNSGIINEMDLEVKLEGIKADGLERIMQQLYKGKVPLAITRVNWEEIQDWHDAQEEILRSL